MSASNLDRKEADDAIKQMKEAYPSLARGNLLHPLALELGDLQNINAVAAKFAAKEERLDILVNNAALLARPLDLDKNGISVSFATNPESNLHRYGLSKLANHLFSAELQRRLDADKVPIVTIGLHPGYVLTGMWEDYSFISNFSCNIYLTTDLDGASRHIDKYHADIRESITSRSLTPLGGALTTIFAAAHPEVWEKRDLYGGAYVEPYGRVEQASEDARDPVLAANLWKASEDVLQSIGA
ncbi:hypothetical protein EIK77_005365 [Talaromyces pinophilus]|nr:hypothetical protein EIK77_005365 [Talaromyces pinophilus]